MPLYLAAVPLPLSWQKERQRASSREESPGLAVVLSVTVWLPLLLLHQGLCCLTEIKRGKFVIMMW